MHVGTKNPHTTQQCIIIAIWINPFFWNLEFVVLFDTLSAAALPTHFYLLSSASTSKYQYQQVLTWYIVVVVVVVEVEI